jgi:hypothetical protein
MRVLFAVVVVGCAGESFNSAPDATPDGGLTSGGSGGYSPGAGGKLGDSGRTGDTGGTVASGGKGGTEGRGGAAGATPTAGRGGSTDGPRECTFEALPESKRCASSAAYAQSSSLEKVPGVMELEACESACEARGDCTGAVFYPPFVTPRRCELYTLPCDAPGPGLDWEENGAKEYRKVCGDGCGLEFVGLWNRCEAADIDPMKEVPGADSADDCFEACLTDPDCTGVSDYFWLDEVPGCYLATEPCGSEVALPHGDPGRSYLASCDETGEGGAGGSGGETGDPETPTMRLALSERHTCMLLTSGRARCWGRDIRSLSDQYYDYVRTGTTQPPDREYTRLAGGGSSTCGADSEGDVDCWSYGSVGGEADVIDLDGAPRGYYVTLHADGKVYADGERFADPGVFTSVARGNSLTCALDREGRAVCVGVNPPGRTFRTLEAGGDHACGLLLDGSVLCFGSSENGATAAPGGAFREIAAGGRHSCGIRVDGSVACWGANDFGQSTPPFGTFTSIEAGADHSCAIRSGDLVECWGNDDGFQSSPPSDLRGQSVEYISVAVGGADLYFGHREYFSGTEEEEGWWQWMHDELSTHGCGLRSDGSLACFGAGAAARPPSGVFSQVTAGYGATCALHGGGVTCFGNAGNPLAGVSLSGDFEGVSTGWGIACAVASGGTVTCWGPAPALLAGGSAASGTFTRVAAGGGGDDRWPIFACGVQSTADAVCWSYRDGESPLEVPVSGPFVDIAAGYTHACGLTPQAAIACWDAATGAALPAPPGTFLEVVAGDHQSCALRTDGSVTCWVVEPGAAAVEIPDGTPGTFVDLSMGGDYACAVLADGGGLKCWGSRVR